jgi:cyclic lactone autoinducer peptide
MKEKNKKETMLMAKVMEKIARRSVEVAINNRCMYIYHQPQIPENLLKFKNNGK